MLYFYGVVGIPINNFKDFLWKCDLPFKPGQWISCIFYMNL